MLKYYLDWCTFSKIFPRNGSKWRLNEEVTLNKLSQIAQILREKVLYFEYLNKKHVYLGDKSVNNC